MLPYLSHFIFTTLAFYLLSVISLFFKKEKFASYSLIIGFILHTIFIIVRGSISGTSYLNPTFEGPFFIPWIIALIAIFNFLKENKNWKYLLAPLVFLSIIAVLSPKGVIPPTPKKTTIAAGLFFLTETIGHAFFYSSAIISSAFLIKKTDFKDVQIYISWGFVFFSISQVIGALWAYYGWGSTFRWSPRHYSTASIWLLYALYLHLRFMSNWNDKRKAIFAIIIALLTFIVSYSNFIKELKYLRIGG